MTATVVHLIGEEHRTIARLLDLIDREVAVFTAGEAPDLDLLASILRYTREFPDRFHHPKEDLIFRTLKERNPAATATVDGMLKEHEEVGRYSEEFATLIERLIEDAEMPRSLFETTARAYLAFQRKHMETENHTVLPLALAHLTEADWAAIDRQVERFEDPLTAPGHDKEYMNLRARIIEAA